MLELDDQQETSWIGGIIDGEGSFRNTKKSGINVRISNTEKDVIDLCTSFLSRKGILHNVSSWHRKNKKRKYEISIHNLNNCSILYKSLTTLVRFNEIQNIIGSSETTRESSSDLWWLVGLIEAEGSLHIAKHERKGGINYHPEVTISNTRKSIIDQMKCTLNEHFNSYYVQGIELSNPNHRNYNTIVISGFKRIARFSEIFLPLFRSKRIKKRMQLISEFCSSRLSMVSKEPYTYRQHEIFRELKNMI